MELTMNTCSKLTALCNYFDKAELGPPEIDGDSITVFQKRMFSASALKRIRNHITCPITVEASTAMLSTDFTKRGKNTYDHVKKMLKVAQIELIKSRATLSGKYKMGVYTLTAALTIRLHPGHKPIELRFMDR